MVTSVTLLGTLRLTDWLTYDAMTNQRALIIISLVHTQTAHMTHVKAEGRYQMKYDECKDGFGGAY